MFIYRPVLRLLTITSTGLQLAERALTGELERAIVTYDRNTDCVMEVDDAHMNAGLAASVTFNLARQQ